MSPHLSTHHKPPAPIRVLLCDGVAVRRALIRDFLEEQGKIVVGEIVGALDDAPRADRVEPDAVITTASELQGGEAVADGVVELPRNTSLAQLRNEVIAATEIPSARTTAIPLLNRPSKRA